MRINNNKGMTTIEACIIIPVSFTIIMLLLWTGILLYNRNVISEAAKRAAIIGSQHAYESSDKIATIVEEKVDEYTCDKLILVSDPTVLVTVSYTTISVNVNGSMKLPESIFFGNIYSDRLWNIDITKSSPRIKSVRIIRFLNRLEDGE